MLRFLIVFSGVLFVLGSGFLCYKSFRLYQKTKDLFLLFIMASFIVLAFNATFQIIRSSLIAENMIKRTKDVYPNYVKYQRGVAGAISARSHKTIDVYGPNEALCPLAYGNYRFLLLILSVLIMLCGFFIKIHKVALRSRLVKKWRLPTIILSIASAFFVYLFFVCVQGWYDLPKPAQVYSVNYYISFIYMLAVFVLGFFLYREKKKRADLYLIISFLIIADLLGLAIVSIPLSLLFALVLPINFPYPFVLRPAIVGVITLGIAYYFSYKALCEMGKRKKRA